jgi:DMSO/TMAO reductase YedYZ molybdopterin-dependent catalytic subunit
MSRPGALQGALVGALLTAVFVAVSSLGWTILGLPFLPFDLFDWVTRALPGSVVTAGIDTTVGVSRSLGATNLGATAKTIEQIAAVGGFFIAGIAAGAVLFGLLRLASEPALLLTAILGAMAGGLAVVVEEQLDRLATAVPFAGPWVFASVFAWTAAFGWAHGRLSADRTVSGDRVATADRRRFLAQLAGTTFASAIAAALVSIFGDDRSDSLAGARWSDTHPLPNANAAPTPLAGTRPEFTPLDRHYRVDTNTRPPRIDAAEWRLRVSGMVQRPLAFTLGDLRLYEPLHQFVTLSCISNPPGGDLISTTRWTGVSLQHMLQALVLSDTATHLRIVSADGFSESVAIAAIRSDPRIMLAYAWDGVPLPREHGFPARLYVPDLYGMKQPKWIVAIEATDRWQPGYWVTRGWDREGRVATASVIDTITAASDDRGSAVELGGIAFAGARGVSRVEVRVDGGEWQPARLREPMSGTTWVLWRARLTAAPGEHVYAVRAFDAEGRPQQVGFHTVRK